MKLPTKKSTGARSDDTNLEGVMPDNWCCIDCGINTAPGMPTRATVEKAMKASCLRSDPKTVASIRFDDNTEVFIVRDSVWKKAGVEPWVGCLCVGCLERRIGRRLTPKDFRRNHPFNSMPGTPRLLERRGDTVTEEFASVTCSNAGV